AVIAAHDRTFESTEAFKIDDDPSHRLLLQLANNRCVARRNIADGAHRLFLGSGDVKPAGYRNIHAPETPAFRRRPLNDLLTRLADRVSLRTHAQIVRSPFKPQAIAIVLNKGFTRHHRHLTISFVRALTLSFREPFSGRMVVEQWMGASQ